MAKKRGKGALLLGAAAMVASGIAAYKHRKEIEETVQLISDQIAAKLEEEEGFFVVDTVEATAVEPVPETDPETEKTAGVSEPAVVDEADLAD